MHWIYYTCFDIIGAKTYNEIKLRYLKSLLAKDAAWYNQNNMKTILTEVHTNLRALQKASGINIGYIIFSWSWCIAAFAWAAYLGIYLALLLSIFVPYAVIVVIYRTSIRAAENKVSTEANERSRVHAEECIDSIKVVKAFNQENYETDKFNKHLASSSYLSKSSWRSGFSIGLLESAYFFGRVFSFVIGALFVTYNVSFNISDSI